MKVILSTTHDDLYYFFLPLVVWSWKKLGIETICFKPYFKLPGYDAKEVSKAMLMEKFTKGSGLWLEGFQAPKDKEATYAQCSRLFGACLDLPEDEILITGDIDMAIFNADYFRQAASGQIHVFGADLVTEGQVPMCYVAMPVKTWREVMWITPGVSYQHYLDELLGPLETEHFRGNYWAKDQETICKQLTHNNWPVVRHNRASKPYSFATRRADRDGWPQVPAPDIIDAHLPRPGFTDENFQKILTLFQTLYPNDDFQWMIDYRNEYIKLL